MGRRLCTDVPQVSNQTGHTYLAFKKRMQNITLPEDTEVWVTMQDRQVPGRVATSHTTPRSYNYC